MAGVLEGIKVVDFTRVISGPTTTQYLADMGATVVKVEPPHTGEVMRQITPVKDGQSGFFISLNRGKRGITLDLKNPKGREVAQTLVAWADVVVENFSPGTMDHFGLSYEAAKERNPQVIYASLSGYGQEGPASRRPSYDVCVQAMSGLLSMNGHPGMPVKLGYSVTDYTSGLLLAMGILGAILHRQKTGEGQQVDVAMYDAGVSLLENAIVRYDMHGEIAEPTGNHHPSASPHNAYKTKDGHITIIAIEDRSWGRLCEAMGRPELTQDEKIGHARGRLAHVDEVDAVVEAWTMTLTTDEAAQILENHHLPYGKVRNAKDVIEDEHTIMREMVVEVDQPGYGPIRIPGNPVKLRGQGAEVKVRGPAPSLGEHNHEIFVETLGMSEEDYQELIRDGAA